MCFDEFEKLLTDSSEIGDRMRLVPSDLKRKQKTIEGRRQRCHEDLFGRSSDGKLLAEHRHFALLNDRLEEQQKRRRRFEEMKISRLTSITSCVTRSMSCRRFVSEIGN